MLFLGGRIMETQIYLVRHGQSEGNANGIYQGHTNMGLSEVGVYQAELTAKRLEDIHIDAVYSSDLARAHNTALPHAKLRGLDVIDSEQLREMYIGDWEGMLIVDLKRDHYQEFVIDWHEDFGNFRFPNGESTLEAADRLYSEILRIAKENLGKTVLIASHAAVIRAFWCKMCGVAPSDMAKAFPFPTNASFSTLKYDGSRFVPGEFSCDDHIPPSSIPSL